MDAQQAKQVMTQEERNERMARMREELKAVTPLIIRDWEKFSEEHKAELLLCYSRLGEIARKAKKT
tara:strand:+ start:44 stop:241 length:198 start_codon:yes stop_codon:yes gene_type:complete